MPFFQNTRYEITEAFDATIYYVIDESLNDFVFCKGIDVVIRNEVIFDVGMNMNP